MGLPFSGCVWIAAILAIPNNLFPKSPFADPMPCAMSRPIAGLPGDANQAIYDLENLRLSLIASTKGIAGSRR
jgi:hypothetical protein